MERSEMFVFFGDPGHGNSADFFFFFSFLSGIGNTPSIEFYESIGAENLGKEWQVMRLVDDTLTAMAKRGPEVERR